VHYYDYDLLLHLDSVDYYDYDLFLHLDSVHVPIVFRGPPPRVALYPTQRDAALSSLLNSLTRVRQSLDGVEGVQTGL